MELPPELLHDAPNKKEKAARIARYLVMSELQLGFTPDKMLEIARDEMDGYKFWGAVHKTWAGMTGNGNGLDLAELEIAAEMLGVDNDIWKPDGSYH